MKTLAIGLAAMAWLVAGWAAPCAAAPITITYTGTVSYLTPQSVDPFGGQVGPGSVFSGTYTFDSETRDGESSPTQGLYWNPGAPYQMTGIVGGFSLTPSNGVQVAVKTNVSNIYHVSGDPSSNGFNFGYFLFLQDLDRTTFANDALPLGPLPLGEFEATFFSYQGYLGGHLFRFAGEIDSLACSAGCTPYTAPVPEPGTLMLVASALAALGLRRRL